MSLNDPDIIRQMNGPRHPMHCRDCDWTGNLHYDAGCHAYAMPGHEILDGPRPLVDAFCADPECPRERFPHLKHEVEA